MCAIAFYLESEGVATTGISLVRENTEAMAPPRFLWVPFPLGRPLGRPDDPAFQHRVIAAALALLERREGPVLEDFPEDAPAPADAAPAACPVSFATPGGDGRSWRARLEGERARLAPWYALSLRRRGRTTVGLADAPVDALAAPLGELLDGSDLAALADDLAGWKRAIEDLKAYYQEALTAQPGELPWQAVRRILWRETELGRALAALAARCAAAEDRRLRAFARVLLPRYAGEP